MSDAVDSLDLETHQAKVSNWLEDNMWCVAIIYMVLGPLLMVFGLQWFPYLAASLVALFVMTTCVSVGFALEWTSTWEMVAVCSVGFILGVLAGMMIRRNIWIMLMLTGLVAGFFAGIVLMGMISLTAGDIDPWVFWCVTVFMALLGAGIAYRFGKTVVIWSTSFVGAYLFTRAWTLIFPGHWPSEAELMEGDVETD